MNIEFQNNSYTKAIKLDNPNSVKNNLYFKYGEIDKQAFNREYSEIGWINRKIMALPVAFWSGIVKSIYHLAKAVFTGLLKAFSDKGLYFKAQIYHVVRDFQKSYGALTSLFNDRYGQFHIQESEFQQTCYDYFIANINSFSQSSPSHLFGSNLFGFIRSYRLKHGIMVDTAAEKITLFNYKEKNIQERQQLIQRFNLNNISSKLPTSNMSLDEFIDQIDLEMLKVLTFEDLIIPFEHSKLKYALLNEETFHNLKIEDLSDDINEAQLLFIQQRLKILNANQNTTEILVEAYDDFKGFLIRNLTQISSDQINKYKEKIPSIAFCFFKNDQIKNLKLSEMTVFQNKALFFALNKTEIKERIAFFDDQDIIHAIHKQVLLGNILNYLTTEQIKKLKIDQLNKEQIDLIFCWNNSDQDVEYFKFFDAESVQKAVEKELLTSTYQLKLLSDEQLKHVQLSKLSKATIEKMFPWQKDNTADQLRFANFDSLEVQAALNAELLTSTYQLKLLSDQQLKHIQLSKLSKTTIEKMFPWEKDNTADQLRFANFDPLEVQTALNAELLTATYQLKLLSDEQLKYVQLSKLSKATIEKMFPWQKDNTVDQLRFANFDPLEVQAALNAELLTTTYQLKLLSDEQIKHVQLSKLSKATIEKMFPWEKDNTADQLRFANFDPLEVQAALHKEILNDYQIKLISVEVLKDIDFSIMSQKIINTLFPFYTVDELREDNSYWSSHFEMKNGVVLEDKQEIKCFYSDEELIKMVLEQENQNETLLAQLSSQQQYLRSRLYQKHDTDKKTQNHLDTQFKSFLYNFFQQEFGGNFFNPFGSSHSFFGKDFPTRSKPNQSACYTCLGLQPNASREEIKNAYKKLAVQYHPDKIQQKSDESDSNFQNRKKENEEKFKEVSLAFATLTKN